MSKKITLLEYSQKSDDYWTTNNLRGLNRSIHKIPSSNLEFEHQVIDRVIIDGSKALERLLLVRFFYDHGKLEDINYFYSNIDKIASSSKDWGKGAEIVYNFCRNSIKGRLPLDVEEKFFNGLWDGYYSNRQGYKYAKYVVRGRLPKNCEKGCKNFDYLNFIHKKNEDFANILINSSIMSYEFYRKNGYLPETVHNYMIAMSMSNDKHAAKYFKQRKKDDKFLRGRLKKYDGSKTVSEILKDLR